MLASLRPLALCVTRRTDTRVPHADQVLRLAGSVDLAPEFHDVAVHHAVRHEGLVAHAGRQLTAAQDAAALSTSVLSSLSSSAVASMHHFLRDGSRPGRNRTRHLRKP